MANLCSELRLEGAYDPRTRIGSFYPSHLSDFNLTDPLTGQRLRDLYGDTVPLNKRVISNGRHVFNQLCPDGRKKTVASPRGPTSNSAGRRRAGRG